MLKSIEGILPQIEAETSSLILAGHFYSFRYNFQSNHTKENTNGWDYEPLILSLGAFKNNPNYIQAINLHFIDKNYLFLPILNSFSGGTMDKDGHNKIFIDTNIAERLYKPSKNAIRIYNKKLITNCYRIQNKDVETVLKYQIGSYHLSTPEHNQHQNELKRYTNS